MGLLMVTVCLCKEEMRVIMWVPVCQRGNGAAITRIPREKNCTERVNKRQEEDATHGKLIKQKKSNRINK